MDHDRAFRETTYRVLTTPPIDLRIGEMSPRADEVLRAYGVTFGAYITSDNPRATIRPETINASTRRELRNELFEWPHVVGESIADKGDWPVEHGFWFLGLSEIHAIAAGRRYGQLAIVWLALGEPVALRWCLR